MKFVIIVFLSSVPLFVSGQSYFEGKIHYAYEINIKSKKLDLKRLQETLGKGSTLLFKDGNFRHNYEGGTFEFEIYNKRDNRLYMKKRDNDTIYWYDCSLGGKKIRDLTVSKQKKKVLDIMCDQLTIGYPEYNKVEYYNNDSIRIDPQWFAAFKRDEQYKVDAIERSIFLRSEVNYPAARIVSEATKIQHEAVSMDVFEIPSNAILLKKETYAYNRTKCILGHPLMCLPLGRHPATRQGR